MNSVGLIMNVDLVIQVTATTFSLTYLFLLMKENIWCWFFAIISAALSIYSFISVKLYSEALLYSAYILFSIYGWYNWSNKADKITTLTVNKLPLKKAWSMDNYWLHTSLFIRIYF